MIRRSNRSTKGQHSSKMLQPEYTPIPNETVRCLVCGTTDAEYNEDEDEREMIECDNCKTWQHVECMYGLNYKGEVPDQYLCDVCDPNSWVGLKKKLSYRMYLERHEGEIESGGKHEEQYGDEDDEVDVDDEVDAQIEADEFREKKRQKVNTTPTSRKSTSQKGKTKIQKTETKPEKSVEKKQEAKLDSKSAALRSSIKQSFENKLKSLLPVEKNDIAAEWASILELGVHENKDDYKDCARRLLINLSTSKLVDRVLAGEFLIEQLPKLSSDEMRTKEQREKDEEVKRKALDQVVLKQEEEGLVKTRVTHRGVEIVGEEEFRFNVEDKRAEEVEKLRNKRDDADFYGDYEDRVELDNEDGYTGSDDNGALLDDDDDFDNILKDKKNVSTVDDTGRSEAGSEAEYASTNATSAKTNEPASQAQMKNLTINTLERDFSCQVEFVSSTSPVHKRNKQILQDMGSEMMSKGRISTTVVDSYLDKVTISRDIYIYQVSGDIAMIWTGYYSISRYGVLNTTQEYVKDCYLVCLSKERVIDGDEGLTLFNKFDKGDILTHLENTQDDKLVYIVYVVRK